MPTRTIGISGLAGYVPPYRVWLEDWCDWTGNQWPKVRDVVGRSFRVRGPQHSMYTMAANAVIRLIDQYDVDPTRVKFLGLGTESSTDNSAGAIIVKGMVDEALIARGLDLCERGLLIGRGLGDERVEQRGLAAGFDARRGRLAAGERTGEHRDQEQGDPGVGPHAFAIVSKAAMTSLGAWTSSISTPQPLIGAASLPFGWMKQTS